RVPTPAARRALAVRDRGCVWPNCERPSTWTQPHHIEHWARHQGGTDRGNLVLLCWRHHEMVHEGRWTIVRSVEGQVTVTPPRFPVFTDGRRSWRSIPPRAPTQLSA
ncbi:MAG: HNH endonuclease signature motif containing protein, partial [Candidatus Dormibacteria bacterium]